MALIPTSPLTVDEMIAQLGAARTAAQEELAILEPEIAGMEEKIKRVGELRTLRDELQREEAALISATHRLSSGHTTTYRIPNDDWSSEQRVSAVLRAVKELTERDGYATPDSIESFFRSRNRTDSKDKIGAALSYLRDKKQVHSPARARWVEGPAA